MSNKTLHAPFRADVVGSFLRPQELKEARKRFAEGAISASELRQIEDRLITDLVAKQKAHGLKAITDGEFRRSYWHLDFMWGFHGVEHIELEHGYQFHGEETTKGSLRLTGKISGENHPFIEDFKFVKQFEEEVCRYIPADKPGYANETLNPYSEFAKIGKTEQDAPCFYAPSLLKTIAVVPGQEIGSHTFSHYYCREAGQTPEEFAADLAAAKALKSRDIAPHICAFRRAFF